MSKIRTFEDLDVWQMGRDLTLKIYEITGHFPNEEVYGMTSQIKRAAMSVPANISEGFGRYHFMDKAKFYLNARGSPYELKSHLLIAKDLGFTRDDMTDSAFQAIDNLSLKLNNLINKTRRMKEG
ncbi:MAG: four helix bundle protein [Desulfatiglandales bacterium]